jgi:hypothetical protein
VTVEGRHSGRRTVGANPHVHPDAEGRPRGRTGGICGPYGEQSGLKQQRPKHPQRENALLAVPGTFLRTPGEAPEARLHPGSRTDQPGLQAKGQVRLPFVSERRVSRAVRPHLSRGRPRYVTASAAEATNCELRFAPPSPTPLDLLDAALASQDQRRSARGRQTGCGCAAAFFSSSGEKDRRSAYRTEYQRRLTVRGRMSLSTCTNAPDSVRLRPVRAGGTWKRGERTAREPPTLNRRRQRRRRRVRRQARGQVGWNRP